MNLSIKYEAENGPRSRIKEQLNLIQISIACLVMMFYSQMNESSFDHFSYTTYCFIPLSDLKENQFIVLFIFFY